MTATRPRKTLLWTLANAKMERIHPLKNLLQFHLASDSSTVFHLPLISSSLTPEAFSPSSHLSKWTTRVNSLIHAKDPGARWAGICLALQTASLSKDMMLECAQGWITIVLPMLSVSAYIRPVVNPYKLIIVSLREPNPCRSGKQLSD